MSLVIRIKTHYVLPLNKSSACKWNMHLDSRLHAFIFGSHWVFEDIFVLSNTPPVHFFDQPRPLFIKTMIISTALNKEALFIITCSGYFTVSGYIRSFIMSNLHFNHSPLRPSRQCCDNDQHSCSPKTVRPSAEGLCPPSTPPLLHCQEDAQPASPWTQTDTPARCCYDHWGWHWCPLPQRPALHGGTFHLNKGHNDHICSNKHDKHDDSIFKLVTKQQIRLKHLPVT